MLNLGTKKRPLSWSAIGSFRYDPDQWYRKYALGQKDKPSIEMLFGNVIGNRLARDPEFLPSVPRCKVFEKKFVALLDDLYIVGYLDTYQSKKFHEYKTASSTNKWNARSAQEHGQMLFYLLLIWINEGIKPEEVSCGLTYIPVQKAGNFSKGFYMELSPSPTKTFLVRHTSAEVLEFANLIKATYKEMLEYYNSRQLSTDASLTDTCVSSKMWVGN